MQPAARFSERTRALYEDNYKASTENLLQTYGLNEQAQAQRNEARYHHALALAALERITAAGFT